MFQKCDFLLGEGDTIVVVIPARLPHAETYTLSVSDRDIRFRAGYDDIAEMPIQGAEIFRRLMNYTQVGVVEYPPNAESFPKTITNVAYIELRRAA
ncbi:hypothetical protein [Micavibrio aeruginosavorus]|uniref:hypothetical protein n=1 Tax=Micavibrio aeruginosavorus TaxID=349221 RepID=UPI003F4ADEDC